jgi:hypothetical protein
MVLTTEGSVKTMSWSRYHALSWSFARISGHRGGHGVRRTRRATVVSEADKGASGVPRLEESVLHGLPVRVLRSILRFFRTGVLPADTDI